MLASSRFEPLRQRIALNYHLQALALEETMNILISGWKRPVVYRACLLLTLFSAYLKLRWGSAKDQFHGDNALLVAYGVIPR